VSEDFSRRSGGAGLFAAMRNNVVIRHKERKLKIRFWKMVDNIGKSLAPIELLAAVIFFVFSGGLLIVYGNIIWLCIGIVLIGLGWLLFAVGWSVSWNIFKRGIGDHC
jgi:hypothetical protein